MITAEFKRAVLKHSQVRTGLDPDMLDKILKKSMSEMKKQLNSYAAKYQKTREELFDAIKIMERRIGPREFLENRKTRICHRILASVSEAGDRALTVCSWRYSKSSFKTGRAPTRELTLRCDACSPEAKAGIDLHPDYYAQ